MRRLRAVSVMVLVCAGPVLAAEKLPPLDAEFLEYLASFGSDEENWALFADEDEPAPAPPPAKAPATQRDGGKPEAAAKPAEQR